MDRYAGFPAVWWGLLGLLIGWVTMWVMDVVFWRRVPLDRDPPPARLQEVETLLRAKERIAALETELKNKTVLHSASTEAEGERISELEQRLSQAQSEIESLRAELVEAGPSPQQLRMMEADKRALTEQISRASEVIRDLEAKLFAAEQSRMGP